MFATRLFRPAAQLSSHVRRYASEAPKSGGSNALLYGAGALGLAGAGYYAMGGSGKDPVELARENTKPLTENIPPAQGGPPDKVFIGGDQGFIKLALEKVDTVNKNTKKFRFKFEDPEAVSGLPVTSAVITKYKGPEDQKPTIRPYTPVSDEEDRGYMDLLVKKYDGGPMSTHLHNMEPGQQLEIKGPIPKYPWEQNKHDSVALLAGGTGITPMYQLCRQIFKNPQDKTKVTLVFGNITEEDILLKKEFEELEQKFPQRFRAFYVLDNPPEGWKQGKGYITKDLLKTVIPGPEEENVKIFVCGPPGLYKAISGPKKSPADQGELSGYLKELGYTKDHVYKF
ncbi:NADH-cytochrome b5 reductase 2 [Fulvia fulva]|uniref:NADH-cytochrome b5 reductase n=1 Tax=Passalora fulva TaxID=5499 RepID=A0A9Q8PHN8_PASFU|nr:NADH-cytochrome b5 reductase 2 [Fulvia fulva]KAK4627267.1 NADH-cytochrome b5 reductase 2 [Fulvia fulva]KAK4627860.1 NADH-cytochrome b5 reductase 2 [Fulvia fulva]UJO22610.1 NADH-cytochrome b5 reductase 2 [Fulvia fulva]WPV13917.1 NADH-cytochrome b5 reductase 2 [Fulvia fulva]WPV28125.1 NADH-cytochrome b5 reductase 2 [Fulvia fulva]